MADIFISYKREDRDRVEPLARALEREAFSVWWDPELPIGQSYASSIRAALNEARVVIPVWTSSSVHSEWVQEEATHGKRRGVLFPVRLDAVDPPIGFTMVETVDLLDWHEGAHDHEEWMRLLDQLRERLRSPHPAPAFPRAVFPEAPAVAGQLVRSHRGSVAIATATALAVLAAFLLTRGGRETPLPDGEAVTEAAAAAGDAGGAAPAAEAPPAPREVTAPPQAAGANASFAEARQLALGIAEPGEIFNKDDTRYYIVPNALRVRDVAVVRLQNESATLRPNLKIFNAEKSQVAEPYDGTPGASLQYVLTLTPGQPIYLQVLPYNSTVKYRISVTPQKAFDTFEPNDNLLTPTAVKVGTDIHGNVMDKEDPDFYRFSGAASSTITVTLENLSTTLRPDVKIFDANKSQLLEKYDSTPGANLTFDADIKKPGDFYVEVEPYNSAGKYRLRVD
jgi:hypothetical protein